MKFPSKVTSYQNSIVPKFTLVLEQLKNQDYTVAGLYEKLRKKMTIKDYIESLDCLYVLGKITLNKEVIRYVERNSI